MSCHRKPSAIDDPVVALIFPPALIGALLFVGFQVFLGCQLTAAQQVEVCQTSIQVLVQPECFRLSEIDDRYVTLCLEVTDSAVVACDAGFNDDPVLMCARLSTAADLCEGFVPGDSIQNVATCQRVMRAASLACTIAVSATRNP